jgi:hypothetical protein
MPIKYRHENQLKESLVRLMGVIRKEVEEPGEPKPGPAPGPRPTPVPAGPPPSAAAAKLYEAKPGFANFYFNKLERDRLLRAFRSHGDFTGLTGEWVLEAEGDVKGSKKPVKYVIREEKDKDGKEVRTVVRFSERGTELYDLEPLKPGQNPEDLKSPPGSGGVLVALFQWRQLLALGEKGFGRDFHHGGWEPFYYPAPEGQKPDYVKQHIDAEVLVTRLGPVPAKWYFAREDGKLLGCEVSIQEREDDPCEVYFSDYKKVDGRMVPHKIEVIYGKERYAQLTVQSFTAKK